MYKYICQLLLTGQNVDKTYLLMFSRVNSYCYSSNSLTYIGTLSSAESSLSNSLKGYLDEYPSHREGPVKLNFRLHVTNDKCVLVQSDKMTKRLVNNVRTMKQIS